MTKTAEFLLEIYSEEIPARFQKRAQEQMAELFDKYAQENAIRVISCKTYISPCRMALCANVEAHVPSETVEKRGPRVGAPEKAIQGFCQGAGISERDLIQKDGYYCAVVVKPEQEAKSILPKIVNDMITAFSWPKVMRYPQSPTPWVRPVRHIMAIYDGAHLAFDVEPLGLSALGYTHGHRFLSTKNLYNDKIPVKDFAEYREKLKSEFVYIDASERENLIQKGLETEASKHGLTLIQDEKLLAETAGLVEYPGIFMGHLDKDLFKAPEIVITTSMRFHQKCFAFRDKTGALAPFFAAVVNTVPKDGGKAMTQGYEMGMLKARLEDARFFYEHDLKIQLESFIPKLDTIIFHEKLGTVGDKIRRMETSAEHYARALGLNNDVDLKRSITLCKTDLLTQMVGEFGELQGVMGEIYAKAQGENTAVAQAIREHYMPAGAEDSIPESALGRALAIMDRMDTLVGFIGHGILPTGSKDPFALRRACLGIIRLLFEAEHSVDLQNLVEVSLSAYKNGLAANTTLTVLEFFRSRLLYAFKDEGMDHDIVEACLSQDTKHFDLRLLAEKVRALSALLQSDLGKALHAGFKRAANIFDAESKKGGAVYTLDPSRLTLNAEKALHAAHQKVSEDWRNDMSAKDQCALLASLKPAIDAFFDEVIVNDNDPGVRQNRLALLSGVIGVFEKYADFRKLEG